MTSPALDKQTLLFVADKMIARVQTELIMRDDARRDRREDIATMHGDRAQAFREVVAAIHGTLGFNMTQLSLSKSDLIDNLSELMQDTHDIDVGFMDHAKAIADRLEQLGCEFAPTSGEDFAFTATLIRQAIEGKNDKQFAAIMRNNFNIILEALDQAAREAPSADSEEDQ